MQVISSGSGEPLPPAGADATNPFLTAAYAASRRSLGQKSFWLVGAADAGGPEIVTSAFMHQGRWTRQLELPSIPGNATGRFWEELVELGRARRVDLVQLDSFASSAAPAEPLDGESRRWPRSEFVIDLDGGDLIARASGTHRQRIRQGARAGLELRQSRSAEACVAHARLIGSSLGRRAERGEAVGAVSDPAPFQALLDAGAGELFQAVDPAGQEVASMLVLRAPRGGYDHSSGSTPEGKKTGASHFLIHATAVRLAEAGGLVLNLGGARAEESGLRDFKLRFGAREVALQSIRLDLRSPSRRAIGRLLQRLGAGR